MALTAPDAELAQGGKRAGFNGFWAQVGQGRPIARHIEQVHEIGHFFIAPHACVLQRRFNFVLNRLGGVGLGEPPSLP
jgi:hypothetical protein